MANTTRQRLADTGFELFSRMGFHAVGLDRILDEAGLSKQTFYNHFESKDELILEVLRMRDEFELESFRRMLHELAGDEAREQLESFFEVMDAWMNHPDFRGCIFLSATAEFPSPHDPAHVAAAEHVRAVERNLCRLAKLAGADEPEMLAEQMVLLIEGAVLLRHATGRTDAARIAGRNAEAIFERHLPEIGTKPMRGGRTARIRNS